MLHRFIWYNSVVGVNWGVIVQHDSIVILCELDDLMVSFTKKPKCYPGEHPGFFFFLRIKKNMTHKSWVNPYEPDACRTCNQQKYIYSCDECDGYCCINHYERCDECKRTFCLKCITSKRRCDYCKRRFCQKCITSKQHEKSPYNRILVLCNDKMICNHCDGYDICSSMNHDGNPCMNIDKLIIQCGCCNKWFCDKCADRFEYCDTCEVKLCPKCVDSNGELDICIDCKFSCCWMCYDYEFCEDCQVNICTPCSDYYHCRCLCNKCNRKHCCDCTCEESAME